MEHINRLIAFLDVSFPDYKKVFPDLQGKTPLSLLEKYPTVQDVLSPENKQDMIRLIKENSHKSYSYAEAKYEKLLQAAEKSIDVCIVNLSSAVLIQTTVSVIFSLQEALKAINDEIKRLSLLDEKFHKEIVLLQSIPGVGEYTACVVLSELGDGSKCNKENLNPVMRVYFENKIAENPYKIVMCVIM